MIFREKFKHRTKNNIWIIDLPVEWNDDECKDARCNCNISHEVVNCTVSNSERPIGVEHKDEIEYTVEQRHHQVRHW